MLIGFAARAPLKVVQPISRENEMGVGIDKSRQHNSPARIDNLRTARILLDLIARTKDVDLAIANQHPAIMNDGEFGHLAANAWPLRTRQRD